MLLSSRISVHSFTPCSLHPFFLGCFSFFSGDAHARAHECSCSWFRYECIYTVALSLPYTKKADGSDSKNVPTVVALCSDILKDFVQDADQNLKCVRTLKIVYLMRCRSSQRPTCVLQRAIERCRCASIFVLVWKSKRTRRGSIPLTLG